MPPRPLRPKDDPNTSEENDATLDSKANKRRAISSACIPCRKRKSKCDGATPSCSTCTAVYRTECFYDADSDHRRKGALKRDIQSLQQQNDALDVIVASLRSLPENEALSLLQSLRGDSSLDLLASSLRSNVRLPHSYAPQTLEADFAQHMSSTPTSNGFESVPFAPEIPRERSGGDSHFSPSASPSESSTSWFRQPQDAEFVEHLLNLYFTWVHPFYHFFQRDLFLNDFTNGRTDHCSAILVNAILAFACHYSERPSARTDPNNPATAGDYYYAECKRMLDNDERPILTTVHALGIMAIRQASRGQESPGYQLAGRCLRMALELGLHLSVIGSGLNPQEAESRRTTFWTVFNLETTCAVCFGRLTGLPRAAADVQKPSTSERSELVPWRPYEDANLALNPSAEQPARPMLFVHILSRLSEMASDMVNTFYAPQERFTSRRLAATYAQYQEWYQNLPEAFRLESTMLPHVIVMHMYYHACVLHLFRPYIKLDLRGAGLYPRDTCTYSANEISSLMNALRAMYGLRRVVHLVCSLVMSASTIHLLNLPAESAANNLSQGLLDLTAMSVNHQFAARCVEIIRSLSAKWKIALPEGAASVSAHHTIGIRAWESPPASTFFAASISRQQSSEGRSRSDNSGCSAPHPQAKAPFSPPLQRHEPQQQQQQQQQQAPQYFPNFYSNPTTPMEASQAQHTFWTPFPAQGMPMQPQALNDILMDFQTQSDGMMDGMQWRTGATNHPITDGMMDTNSMGGMESNVPEWGWQQ